MVYDADMFVKLDEKIEEIYCPKCQKDPDYLMKKNALIFLNEKKEDIKKLVSSLRDICKELSWKVVMKDKNNNIVYTIFKNRVKVEDLKNPKEDTEPNEFLIDIEDFLE